MYLIDNFKPVLNQVFLLIACFIWLLLEKEKQHFRMNNIKKSKILVSQSSIVK